MHRVRCVGLTLKDTAKEAKLHERAVSLFVASFVTSFLRFHATRPRRGLAFSLFRAGILISGLEADCSSTERTILYHFSSPEIKCEFRRCGWAGAVNAHSRPLSMRIEVKAASGSQNSPHPGVTIAPIPMTTPCPSRWTPCHHRHEHLAAKSVPNRAVMAQKKCNLAL